MEQNKEYYAFISYKREDEKWAKWLQDKLEHYKFPTNLNGRTDLPRNIRPTFRDVTDMTPGLLAEKIDTALRDSEWLIVICSPRSAKSPWVCKEAQTFIDLGRADHIIPFVIEGNPFSSDTATECYPEALLNLTGSKELLATNINEMGRDAAAIKIVARMFNLRFDTLWQRYEREQKRKRWTWVSSSILMALLGLSIASYFVRQNGVIERQNERLMQDSITMAAHLQKISDQNDSITSQNNLILSQRDSIEHSIQQLYLSNSLLAEERDNVKSANHAMQVNLSRVLAEKASALVDEGDSYLVRKIALQALPPNLPYTPEAETSLRRAVQHSDAILKGHTNIVKYARYSPDEKYIISVSYDNTVRIWDSCTGACLRTINVYRGSSASVFFDSIGNAILATSALGSLNFYDINSCEHLHSLEVTGAVCSDYSPNTNIYVTASLDNKIRVWDAKTHELKNTLTGHTDRIYFVTVSPDGKTIASSSKDKTIRIWNISSGKNITLEGHSAKVNSVLFSKDGMKIVSASDDKTIRIWNPYTGKCLTALKGHSNYVTYAAFSYDGRQIVSSSWDKTIRIWNAYSGDNLSILKGHTEAVEFVTYSLDGKKILSTSDDKTIRIWNVGREIKDSQMTLKGHSQFRVYSTKYSPDGKYIVSASDDKTIRLWDSETGNCIKVLD